MRARILLLALLATLFVGLAGPPRSAAVPAYRDRVAKLIADLNDNNFRVREAAQKELIRLGGEALPDLRKALRNAPSVEAARRIEAILALVAPVYEAHSNGWHWVYQGIAHGQTFQATGQTVEKLRLRVARLNANEPAARLEVEIRDPGLEKIYFRGSIEARDSETTFRWREVKISHRADLQAGETYILIFHSQATSNKAPWVVNAIYEDRYPHGSHAKHAHEDFFFEFTFDRGLSLRVGPEDEKTSLNVPISSGSGGGTSWLKPLSLAGERAIPPGDLVKPASER